MGGSSISDARGELPRGEIFFNEGALPLPVLPEKHCIVKTVRFFSVMIFCLKKSESVYSEHFFRNCRGTLERGFTVYLANFLFFFFSILYYNSKAYNAM